MTDRILRYRWWIISFSLLAGVCFGVLIPFSGTDPDIRNYIPPTLSSREETDRIESEFGVQDMVVILFSDSCILNAGDLSLIRETDRYLSRLGGVSGRISPFTVRSIKGENGMLVADKLIPKLPSDGTDIQEMQQSILKNRFARDIVFSSDMSTAAITATINTKYPEGETLTGIDSVISSNAGQMKVLAGGLPYIRRYILRDVQRDAIILVPAALLIILLILKLTLGEWRSVMMPFSVVVISTVISLGLIPLLGWKMSVLTLLVPIILVAVANNYGIYLVARYQDILRSAPATPPREVIGILLRSLDKPILFSGLTTIAGILGLLTHSVIPARQVGVLAAAGVTIALILSLVLIPAMLSLRKATVDTRITYPGKSTIAQGILSSLAGIIIRHPGRILAVSGVLTIFFSIGILFVRIDTNQENFFPADHPVRQASSLINNKFGGSQTISVMVSGDIKSPEVMQGIDRLTTETEKMPGVGKVFSVSQVVREMTMAIYSEKDPEYDRIPSTGDAIAQLFELYNMSGDPDDFRQLMNLDNTRAHILVRLSDPSNEMIIRVKEKIGTLAREVPADVTVGGYAVILADFAESVIRGQVTSLLFALTIVFMLLAIIFRSVKGGLAGSIPLAVSIIILFGFMGFAGIALDAATALLSSIMIGAGVDFTIQYIWCYNRMTRSGLSAADSTRQTFATIGRSIFINALSVMAGFSALMLSGFSSIRFFGYLVFISIGACLAGAVLIIPAFLLRFRPRFAEEDMGRKRRLLSLNGRSNFPPEESEPGIRSKAV